MDAETEKQIPLQCSFHLTDEDENLVMHTSHYPDEQVMDTWTTNAEGEVTPPMLLEEGTYTITEVQAPEGYVLELEGKQLTVGTVYNGWDDPIGLYLRAIFRRFCTFQRASGLLNAA